ncbi:hypothetical protein N656DRAFT_786715 [Canariomyces notabilis]|uniref:Uncharacterized protein n=1 Tax=Canariomyces notabilis TaxID=2074819 RepID=A0AAN6TKW8_9PEZI|nr:hypothetical protein N656DRAFT_786715 [Canariomyces arenarius]
MDQHSGSATLPRGFRYSGCEAPKTPEPSLQSDDARIPSPPRPRLKLRRRVVSQLSAPTQQFLASVAAADVPIPSIEEPEIVAHDFAMSGSEAFPGRHQGHGGDVHLLQPPSRLFSPPKTPAPELLPSQPLTQYPDWTVSTAVSSAESTPEPDYESSRPSTSRSTQTSASLFSHLSNLSDDDHCEIFADEQKSTDVVVPGDNVTSHRPMDPKGKARKAPWTKAMSDHLWSTFVLYLQDPKVTPFRMGKSCIPPHGVCHRVAREAKRSWKGSKALAKAANPVEDGKSGSTTPTAGSSGTFIQWPHTCAATRAHLRELCRLKASTPGNNHRFKSRSNTPFTQSAARHWNRRSTPARSPGPFATQDMNVSLTLSTSESMQPSGPLAQLAVSGSEPTEQSRSPIPIHQDLGTAEDELSFAERRRLASPFGASSYGPSSSGSLAAVLGLSDSTPRRQSHTVGPRRTLQSPVRLSRSGTQKRRHTQSGVPRKRPSIGSDLWLKPSLGAGPAADTISTEELSPRTSNNNDGLFTPRLPAMPALTSSASMPSVGAQLEAADLAPPPPRLGSPFSGASSSFSFPHRVHRMQGGSVDLGVLGRPFATIQQFANESTAPPSRHNLAGRLAYIDQRLKELRQRDANRRSESPL